MFFGYLASSLCAGAVIWGAVLSAPFINSRFSPVDIASAVFSAGQRDKDPMIIASDAELFLIEPAAGPAKGCE